MSKKAEKKTTKKTTTKAAGAKKVAVKKAAPKKTASKTTKKVAKKTAPKTTKKTASKATKTAKKTTSKKSPAKKKTPLVISSSSTAFFATNGAVMHSMLELYEELAGMLEEEFAFHASSAENNHFSNWVREILKDEECAEQLAPADTRRKARSVLKKHLEKYITN